VIRLQIHRAKLVEAALRLSVYGLYAISKGRSDCRLHSLTKTRMFFFPRRIAFPTLLAVTCLTPLFGAHAEKTQAPHIEGIRFWSFGDITRVAIETSGDYKLYSEQIDKPSRVFFDLTGLEPPSGANHSMETIAVNDHRIRRIRVARLGGNKTRVVFDLECPVEVVSSQLVNPDRLMIEIRPRSGNIPELNAEHSVTGSQKVDLSSHNGAVDSDIADPQSHGQVRVKEVAARETKDDPADAYHPVEHNATARPPSVGAGNSPLPPLTATVTARAPLTPAPVAPPAVEQVDANTLAEAKKIDNSGDRSLVRVFGLKLGRVVIDAGHGGHDSGTIGPNGLMEKDLVLDVALRLGALITKQMGAQVVYTRKTDVFIPLEERTKIANDQKADLFISVHANSSPEPSATGVETYYFNLTSDKSGLDLATRENATADSSISDLNDLLHRAVLETKREESREFAQKVQASLLAASRKTNSNARDRGVRQAPFVVLIGASMPSILAEIGFVSNPRDERLLRRSDQREKIAEALYKGVLQYANSLNHEQMARVGTE
jgi:N-acetylmuramoyl-L-alanine amidase